MAQRAIDFGLTAQDYATHRAGFPEALFDRVAAMGDANGARILQRILDDEIRHVRFGTKHFDELCRTNDEMPREKWQNLIGLHFRGRLKSPFNDSAREAAGLPRDYRNGIV